MGMDIRLLRYFLAVCEEGNISQAARSLYITQPTLSRQIAEFEREIGSQLFIRKGRQMMLTDKGVYLQSRAREILSLVQNTEEELKTNDEILAGTIHIAAGESWALQPLAALIREFREQYPEVTFAVHTGNGEDVAMRIELGLADFGVFMGKHKHADYEVLTFQATDTWGLIMPEDAPLAQQESITVEDLCDLPLVASEGTLDHGDLATWLNPIRNHLNIACTYTLAYNAAMLVIEHVGYAVTFDRIIATNKGSGLVFRPLAPAVTSPVEFAWKQGQHLSHAARAFLEIVHSSDIVRHK
ncbi:LysR family transcriptional regulator [Bifidobacterium dolichotidis]|uniref:LysR family transcriptional regulator n=2 Tax=Bifidobacterium dolichotidis TaxID=2306976 RepID=A0A430FST0_9BIFI|nr:LysR family transcriptional regulator [Bifidobacterium dolichotidis]